MSIWNGEIQSEYLGAEASLIDLGGAFLVSDHPPHMGGSGRGPTPGELLKGGVVSSVALALGRAAERGELPLGAIGVRCGSTLSYEPLEDGRPLNAVTVLPGFMIEVVVTGRLTPQQVERAKAVVRGARVVRALEGDLVLDEANAFSRHETGGARGDVGVVMETHGESRRMDLLPPEERERVSALTAAAEYLGDGRALITWGAASLVAMDDEARATGVGTAPEALVMASLIACTTVFAARAMVRSGGAGDLRVTCEGRFDDAGSPVGVLRKRLNLVGDLSARQQEDIAFCADHCALGATLGRRADVAVNIHVLGQEEVAAAAAAPAHALLQRLEPVCDDGECCVPAFAPN